MRVFRNTIMFISVTLITVCILQQTMDLCFPTFRNYCFWLLIQVKHPGISEQAFSNQIFEDYLLFFSIIPKIILFISTLFLCIELWRSKKCIVSKPIAGTLIHDCDCPTAVREAESTDPNAETGAERDVSSDER